MARLLAAGEQRKGEGLAACIEAYVHKSGCSESLFSLQQFQTEAINETTNQS